MANTLMEHLPPSGWSDVARTHDIERLDNKIDAVHRDIKGLRTTLNVTIGVMITVSLGIFGYLFQISQAVSGG